MKILNRKNILLIVFVLILSSVSYAQSPPDFVGNNGSFEPNDNPIDGPISGLVALGVVVGTLIGIRKLK